MENKTTNYTIPMLEKGFELLEFISSSSGGVPMRDLVENLKISKTTIYRLLISLCEMGYIYKNEETAEYFLSKKMLRVGLSAIGEHNLVEQAMPLMRSLRDEIGEIVMLGVLMNNRTVLLEQIPGSYSFTFLTRPGTTFVTHASVPGKVFAAFSGDYEREKILDAIDFVKFNENTIVTLEDFERELDQVRQLGYAVDFEEEVKGVNCLGVPIYNQFGNITASLWTSGPSGRLSEQRILEIKDTVIETANKISGTLGYRKR
ncbi:MAG: IclR family transcriptional regulator [Rikenellaceae bacterium]